MAATKEQLDKINSALPRTNIKGNEYILVAKRVQAFRELYPSGLIKTEIYSSDKNSCTFRAEVFERIETEGGYEFVPLANGFAHEQNNGRGVNSTSMYENCETSAIGRALGIAGIGSVEAIASADEVANAQAKAKQKAQDSKKAAYLKAIGERENECVQLGIKATGLVDWRKATFEQTDTTKLNIEQLTEYGKHLASLISSAKTLKEEAFISSEEQSSNY